MNKYNVKTINPFLHPLWLNGVKNTTIEIPYSENMEYNNEKLIITDEHDLKDGEMLRLTFGTTFYAVLSSEYQKKEQQKNNEKKEEILQEINKRNQIRKEAELFNQNLNIPIKWRTGMKDVLSGLGENSNGDGVNKATVGHIEILEEFKEGKLERNAGDFLCSKNKGKQWSGTTEKAAVDGNNEKYNAKVTCKYCLKQAKRWKKNKIKSKI